MPRKYKAKKRGQPLIYFYEETDVVTPTAAMRGAIEVPVTDLRGELEAAVGEDGKYCKILSILVDFRAYTEGQSFSLVPVLIQTSGAVADTVDINERQFNKMLDSASATDYGYRVIGRPKVAKNVPGDDPTAATTKCFGVETGYTMPQDIISLVNRTPREYADEDRIIILGYALRTMGTAAHYIHTFWFIEYEMMARSVVLR